MNDFTFKLEGLEQTVAALDDLSKSMERAVVRRTLIDAAEPTAVLAARLAPHDEGILSFSIGVGTQLTGRHKSEQRNRASEVEVYIGPRGGLGALFYASFQEFGTINMPAHPFLRPAWEATKAQALGLIVSGLAVQVEKVAARAARKAARLAA